MTADKIIELNGVKVNQKIIPDGTRWKDSAKAIKAGFEANALYKAQVQMTKVKTVTVHNTEDLERIEKDAERYVLATYNENMLSTRPHAYTDDIEAWQLLRFDEVGWCNGRGTLNTGAIDDISIECIMGEDAVSDAKAEDNAARLAAYLLHKNKLDITALRTHTYWINLGLGVKGSIDYMNTYKHPKAGKYCPYYILPHWSEFKALVKKYLDELNNPEIYRVRRSWLNAISQIGAYTNLESAKALADFNRGYKVYNSKGKLVYQPKQYYARYMTTQNKVAYKAIPATDAKTMGWLCKGISVTVHLGSDTKATNGTIWVQADYNEQTIWLPLKYLRKEK